ncbi:double-strand break repair protein AddB [Pseudothioclava arenosa]|uniref:Double-strand break repair protein AddB n=1 Tax=Pseudothioclava arenosa TaxID=1795308 RepID=A0A2A4CQJ9_9RHOB|nr:double-strand break repair protein AddB [Pseudothioclava arenosa]PCD76600.1 double-strand break repair protein AddB [Pseudothioclava arenosa]
MTRATLFALPPGVDFAAELVRGLIDRYRDRPPEELARLRLYLNAGRMKRRVQEEFDAQGALLLPRIGLVTDLGRAPVPGLAPAIPGLRRRLELAQLVEQFVERLPGFEAGADVFGLSDSLARLMAEMQTEGVSVTALEGLNVDETHAEHWRASLEFIRIVGRFFEDSAELDAEARQRRVIEALVANWSVAPPRDPILIAGSTGSRGATRQIMEAAARLANGAVVLPGFDFEMPPEVWNSLDFSEIPLEDHPQYRFLALCRSLGLQPAEVQRWTEAPVPCAARNRVTSLALRPAPVTDQWMSEGQGLGDLRSAMRDVSLVEAASPRQEALSIALIMRNALEQGRKVALISPDRMLTRRVSVALDRWGIRPDDSAGEPLHQTAPGRLLRHVAQAMGRRPTLETLLILLKHPLVATGSTMRGDHLRLTRELELTLRRKGCAFPDADAVRNWAARDPSERELWAEWITTFLAEIEPDLALGLAGFVARLLRIVEGLAAGPGGSAGASELWLEEGGAEARLVMEGLSREAGAAGDIARPDHAELVARLLQAGTVRHGRMTHPQAAIWGTLEARTQDADLVILGGLNEGVWPSAPEPDPWLSRRMRLESGLLLPERQIGLAAHDFEQAIAAPEVVLTRARRDDEAETVPSRWLNRLLNLIGGLPGQNGDKALEEMRTRGAQWIALAERLDVPAKSTQPEPRPSPRPPPEVRPRELPVTAIKTLIRDPYAIYAQRILRLRKLDPVRPAPDARLRGQALHLIVEKFIRTRPEDETPEAAQARLLALADEVLEAEVPFPGARRLWRARVAAMARGFVQGEAERSAAGTPVIIEQKGSVSLQNVAFVLTAKPDRIDLLEDGSIHIYDYKSGQLPTDKQVLSYDKQLLLEAAIAERGGFEMIGPRHTSAMTYVGLSRDAKVRQISVKEETIAQVWEKLGKLIAAYLSADQGYTARRAMLKSDDISDYDHLSRFGEWDLSEPGGEDKA